MNLPGTSDRRDVRLHRFGIGLGLVAAGLLHVLLFWGPRVPYRPALEKARIRRVLVARPYRPAPPPPPPEHRPAARSGDGGGVSAAAPPPTRDPVSTQEPSRTDLPRDLEAGSGGGEVPRSGLPEPARTDAGAPIEESPSVRRAPSGALPRPDPWKELFAEMKARGKDLEERPGWGAENKESRAPGSEAGKSGSGEGEGAYLDSRIRITVVSYPPTNIEQAFPAIPYPDLRFHRKELQKGICRVWYRVWTDGMGRVVRTQLKTPTSPAARARYRPFIEAVENSVSDWPFDRREAEIHVDVLFEIE